MFSATNYSIEHHEKNPTLLHISLFCMCQLLTSAPHFNFRVNLMTVIIDYCSMKGTADVCSFESLLTR